MSLQKRMQRSGRIWLNENQMKNFLMIIISVLMFVRLSGQAQSDVLMKANALVSLGKPDEAITELSAVISDHTDFRYLLQRAQAYVVKGDHSSAIVDYNSANEAEPYSGSFGLAKIYALKGDVQTALYHLEQNLSSQWKRSEKEIMLDPAFGRLEKTSEWRSFWKQERYSEIERTVSEIEYYTSKGNNEDSKALISVLKSRYPGNDEVIYSEALLNLSSGKSSEAVRLMSELTNRKNSDRYLRLLAKAQIASSNYAGASNTYTRIINNGVADADVLLARAECFRKTGENDKAIADVDKYLAFYPEDMNALRTAGRAHAVAGDNLKALELFSRNLELHPSESELYIDRGNSYLAARSWEWAIADYSMSLDLKPSSPDAWLNKGIALLNSGKTGEACHDFRKALSLGNKKAAEYISRNCIK